MNVYQFCISLYIYPYILGNLNKHMLGKPFFGHLKFKLDILLHKILQFMFKKRKNNTGSYFKNLKS